MKATDHGRTDRAWARRLAALVCLAGLGLNAHALDTTTFNEKITGWSSNGGSGWTRNAQSPSSTAARDAIRSWSSTGTGSAGRVIATDIASIAGRAGALPVSSAMSVGIRDAAAAVARCMLGGGIICGAASAAAGAYAIYRVYEDEYGGGLQADPGVAPVLGIPNPTYYNSGVTQYLGADVGTAARAQIDAVLLSSNSGLPSSTKSKYTYVSHVYVNLYGGSSPGIRFTQRQTTCTGAGMTGTCTDADTVNNTRIEARCMTTSGSTVSAVMDTFAVAYHCIQNANTCPASIDAANPAYNVPAGQPVGIDGKCPTARSNRVAITAEAAADKVAANPPPLPIGFVQPLRDAIETGGQSAPAGITTTGPATQTGTQTTTTTTGGSPTQTVTETKTPTYTYNYAGDTITYNTTTTTVTNNITTGVTTTTTTTEQPKPPEEAKDPCNEHPDRIGCMTLGDTPNDVVPKKSENLSFSTESVGLPSGCPADQVIAGKTFSYGPMCDAATSARPWIIVGGIFSALMLMLAAVRQI